MSALWISGTIQWGKSMMRILTEQDFDAMYELMILSFPQCERRNREEQRALFNRENYQVYGWYEKTELVAFLAAHDMVTFRFIEHLATKPAFRGQSIGQKLMTEYQRIDHRIIVLEVEPDENPLTHRRIGFYQRFGFFLYSDFPYVQPSFYGQEDVPLCLMVNREHLKQNDLLDIQRCLYRDVYNQDRL